MISIALNLIRKYYGNKRTSRSKVLLINHIDEGLAILNYIGSTQLTKDAYCLHPILQSDEDFLTNRENFIPPECIDAAILAMEYRRVANSYLSSGKIQNFVGFSCEAVREMLIADKVQNYKDFLLYHVDTHPNAKTLDTYFTVWFSLLEINYSEYVKCITSSIKK